MQALIRGTEAKDLTAIHAIETASFSSPWSLDALEHELVNPISHNYVLEEDGNVIGYICYWMIIDEVHLLNIVIHPDHRGNGWSRFLMFHMIEQSKAENMKKIVLEVRENNHAAIRLYERYKFAPVGRIANYYPEDKQDAIIMQRDLS